MNSPGRVIGVLYILPTLIFALVFPLTVAAAKAEATLQWARIVALSTPVSGVIAEVNVDRGEHVHADQVLLRLDNEILSTEVVAARARLKQAENNRDEAQRELER
ncbi:MAG: biotin/lipoyl-binding protein [Gammaproteobacteria bacterium]|nr:biotin/lipoyl-binding protein [Gammaproteobacteria bacterium]